MCEPLIDWSLALNLLRSRSRQPLAVHARECRMGTRTLNELARGERVSPRFDQGVRLLDLCSDYFTEEDWARVRDAESGRVRMMVRNSKVLAPGSRPAGADIDDR